MDEVDESYLQLTSYLGNNYWIEAEEDTMNLFIEWAKRKSRNRKIRDYVNSCIEFCKHDFHLDNCYLIDSNHCINCQSIVANSLIRINIIKSLYDLLEEDKNIVFAGRQISGAILASEMALFRKTDAIIINSENTPIFPYGVYTKNKKIILVEDVVSDDMYIEELIYALGGNVSKIICAVNFTDFSEIDGVEIRSILKRKDIKIG